MCERLWLGSRRNIVGIEDIIVRGNNVASHRRKNGIEENKKT